MKSRGNSRGLLSGFFFLNPNDVNVAGHVTTSRSRDGHVGRRGIGVGMSEEANVHANNTQATYRVE